MKNDSDFVEDATIENNSLFDEMMNMDEETSMQKNNESRWDLSIGQVVKTIRELSADSDI